MLFSSVEFAVTLRSHPHSPNSHCDLSSAGLPEFSIRIHGLNLLPVTVISQVIDGVNLNKGKERKGCVVCSHLRSDLVAKGGIKFPKH